MSPRWLVVATLSVAAFVLIVAGMVRYTRVVEAGLKDAKGPSGSVKLLKARVEVPAFTAPGLDGRPVSTAALRGKVVLVNFWATWCPPCREEIPDLIALQKKYKDRLVIIGVSEDDIAVEEVKRFAEAHAMSYPIVMTTPDIRKQFTGIVALPTTFVIDRDGRLVQKHVGMLNAANTEAETRVLAGIDTTAKVEYIENSPKARLEQAAKAKAIPGIDLSTLTELQKNAVVQALIAEGCTCGCCLTLAVCRLDDPTCPVSLPMAQDIVKKYSATP